MDKQRIQDEAEAFFEWPTADKTHVTTTSMLIFASVIARMAAEEATRAEKAWRSDGGLPNALDAPTPATHRRISMSDVAYSTNDEEFVHREREDALQALANDGRLVEGEIYWEIDVEEVGLAEYISSARVLEFAAEQIYDDVGEAAGDAFSATQEASDELDAFVATWCEKHFASEHYWRCKGRSRELKVTAEDIAGFAGDQA